MSKSLFSLPDATIHWHSQSIDRTCDEFKTDLENGLTSAEARKRLIRFGKNILPSKKPLPAIALFFLQFHNVILYLLIGIMIFCFIVQDWKEGFVIFAVLILNAIIGFIQENQAQKDSEALSKMLSLTATVIRDGQKKVIDADSIVLGDILLLQSGDKIPADCRLAEAKNFHTQEAALTGESTANPKSTDILAPEALLAERQNCAYSGTYSAMGTAKGIVFASGTNTELGKINTMVSGVKEEKTPLTQQISRFGHFLVAITMILIIIAFIINMVLNDRQTVPVVDAIIQAACIGIALVPEGLATIVTLALAIGMRRMSQKKAVIRSMPAVETLGAVSVICSDKTGTLTTNQMTARAFTVTGGRYSVGGNGYDPLDGEIMDMPQNSKYTLSENKENPMNEYTLSFLPGTADAVLMQERVNSYEQEKRLHAELISGPIREIKRLELIRKQEEEDQKQESEENKNKNKKKKNQYKTTQPVQMNTDLSAQQQLKNQQIINYQQITSPSLSIQAADGLITNTPLDNEELPFYLDPMLGFGNRILIGSMLRCGVLCNDSKLTLNDDDNWDIIGDTTEGSLYPLAMKAKMNLADYIQKCPRIDEIPFESDYGWMATVNRVPYELCDIPEDKKLNDSVQVFSEQTNKDDQTDNINQKIDNQNKQELKGTSKHTILFLKGAPERIFDLCTHQAQMIPSTIELEKKITAKAQQSGISPSNVIINEFESKTPLLELKPLDKGYWKQQQELMAEVGLRTIALAQRVVPAGRFPKRKDEKYEVDIDQDPQEFEKLKILKKEREEKEGKPKEIKKLENDFEKESDLEISPGEALRFSEVREGGFILLGLIGIFDPPRPEAQRAIRRCRRARIKVVMITGDHAKTAQAVGKLLTLKAEVVKTSTEIAVLSDEVLDRVVDQVEVYARATPADKLRIVKAMQRKGLITAMTGDGVNDSPALKQANVGIAMGVTGTEVAKEASKMVLMDDNFATIVKAVEEGRIVYNAIKRCIGFTMGTNVAQALALLVATFFKGKPPPITPLQSLWVNTITSVLLSSFIPFQKSGGNVITKPPRDIKKSFLTSTFIIRTLYVGSLTAAAIILYYFSIADFNDEKDIRRCSTVCVNMLTLMQVCYLFNWVYLKESSFRPRVFIDINWPSLLSIVVLIILQIILTYVPFMNVAFDTNPIRWYDWFIALAVGVGIFFVVEIEKFFRRIAHNYVSKQGRQRRREQEIFDREEEEENRKELEEELLKRQKIQLSQNPTLSVQGVSIISSTRSVQSGQQSIQPITSPFLKTSQQQYQSSSSSHPTDMNKLFQPLAQPKSQSSSNNQDQQPKAMSLMGLFDKPEPSIPYHEGQLGEEEPNAKEEDVFESTSPQNTTSPFDNALSPDMTQTALHSKSTSSQLPNLHITVRAGEVDQESSHISNRGQDRWKRRKKEPKGEVTLYLDETAKQESPSLSPKL